MDKLKVKVIIGSTREGRFSDKVASWLMAELAKNTEIEAEALDLRDYPMPFFDQQETPSYKSKPYADPVVVKWTAKIAEADAFIMIAPEYNHGYSAVLKNALDWVYQEWNNKPVGFVSYGSVAGGRAIEQLREVVIELQMAPIRNAVHIAYDAVMAVSKGAAPAQALALYVERAQGLVKQLTWWARALKAAQESAQK